MVPCLVVRSLSLGACTRVMVFAWSFVHLFILSIDHYSLLKFGKGMNMLNSTMARNVIRGFSKTLAFSRYGWFTFCLFDYLVTCRLRLNSRTALRVRRHHKKAYSS